MIVIGIAGGTCSGKSTLSETLNTKLTEAGKKVALIHMDAIPDGSRCARRSRGR